MMFKNPDPLWDLNFEILKWCLKIRRSGNESWRSEVRFCLSISGWFIPGERNKPGAGQSNAICFFIEIRRHTLKVCMIFLRRNTPPQTAFLTGLSNLTILVLMMIVPTWNRPAFHSCLVMAEMPIIARKVARKAARTLRLNLLILL